MRCLLPQEKSMFLSGVRSFKSYEGDIRLCHIPKVQLFFSIETQDCRGCDTKQGVRYLWLTKIRVTDIVINKYVSCNTCNKRVVMFRNGFPCMVPGWTQSYALICLEMVSHGIVPRWTQSCVLICLEMVSSRHGTENVLICLEMASHGLVYRRWTQRYVLICLGMVSPGMVPGMNSQLCLDMFRNGFHRHGTGGELKICLDMLRNGFHRHATGGELEHMS